MHNINKDHSAPLNALFLKLARITGKATSRKEATFKELPSYMAIVSDEVYTGYQLVEYEANGAMSAPFGFPDVEPPLTLTQMIIRLEGLIKGIEYATPPAGILPRVIIELNNR